MDKVKSFSDEFHFLSNFHPVFLLYEGIVWPSSEHAYQAMKAEDSYIRLNIAMMATPGEAKRCGKVLKKRVDWDDVKLTIMEEILRAKFDQNPHLRNKLLATEDLELEEGNTWGDTFWGVCKGVGHNHLGKLLMKLRAEYRNA